MSTLVEFNEMIRKGNFVVLDTETTGLHEGEICDIAIIDSQGDTLLDTLVQTIYKIPHDAIAIHGINNSMVEGKPFFRSLVPQIVDIVTGKNVVVYNAIYDRRMLHQSAERAELPKTDWKAISPWWCAMEAYAEHYGDWNSYKASYRWQKLTDAYWRMTGTQLEGAHRAITDARATLQVVLRMAGVIAS